MSKDADPIAIQCGGGQPRDTEQANPLESSQIARGWLQIASDDFPGPILVCVARDALDACQAASRGLGTAWPPLQDGTYPPAPLFTPSEIDELERLCGGANDCSLPADPATPAGARRLAAPLTSAAAGAGIASEVSATPSMGARGDGLASENRVTDTLRLGTDQRGTFDRLSLLRAVVAAKRALGAKVVPFEKWRHADLEERPEEGRGWPAYGGWSKVKA